MPPVSTARSFLRTFGQAEMAKGLSAEEKAFQAAMFYYPRVPWLKCPRKATREEDFLQGIDLVFETKDIGDLYIQIKSSQAAVNRYKEQRRRIMVGLVIVKPPEVREIVWGNLLFALNDLRKKILEKRGCRH